MATILAHTATSGPITITLDRRSCATNWDPPMAYKRTYGVKGLPKSYGATVDQDTGELYDQRGPPAPRPSRPDPKERARAKAARKSRRLQRTRSR